MVDVDTFLTALYATVDDFHKSRSQEDRRPGSDASLSPSEVATLSRLSAPQFTYFGN